MSHRAKSRNEKFLFCLVYPATLFVFLVAAAPVFGQLTEDDIAALRERGQKEGWTFTVEENAATKYPIEQLCGIRPSDDWEPPDNYRPVVPTGNLPASFDWRSQVGTIPVRDQDGCGSCWAHAAVGAFEWAIKIRDGMTVDLAEQWLVSCNQSGYGCGGGGYDLGHGYHAGENDPCGHTGAVSELDFPYEAVDLPCNCPYDHPYILESWGFIGDNWGTPIVEEIKTAILEYGPVSVCVAVDAAFFAYSSGIFNADYNGLNHAVVLVGWDDNQGANGVWFLRNSWGDGWGEDGYMRIEYECSRVGEYGSYVFYNGPQAPGISFTYPNGIPDTIGPYQPTPFEVVVESKYNGRPVPGSGQLHYTINGGPVESEPMLEISPAHYEAILPRITCDDVLEYYISAEEETGGRFYDPDPGSPHVPAVISAIDVVFADDFSSDKGWTVSGDVTAGHWVRGIPVGPGDQGDPRADYDGSFICYLTGNGAGDPDVDGGATYLDSPVFDLSESDGRVQYARWYSNDTGEGTPDDVFVIYVSNDNGLTWTEVETVGPSEGASGGWVEHTFWAGEFVTPTGQMKMRFVASDLGDNSVVEAALDAFTVSTYDCECDCSDHCDLNLDGALNPIDVVYLVNYVYLNNDLRQQIPSCPGNNGDWNCDGNVNPVDVVYCVNFVYNGIGLMLCDPCVP